MVVVRIVMVFKFGYEKKDAIYTRYVYDMRCVTLR